MRCALPKNLAFLIFFKGRNSTQCFVTIFSGKKSWTFFHFNEKRIKVLIDLGTCNNNMRKTKATDRKRAT